MLHRYSIKHDHESDTDTKFIKGDMTCVLGLSHSNYFPLVNSLTNTVYIPLTNFIGMRFASHQLTTHHSEGMDKD